MRLMKLSGPQASGKTTLLRQIQENSGAHVTAFFQQLTNAKPVEDFVHGHSASMDVLVLVDGCSDKALKEIELLDFHDKVTVIVAVTEPVRSRSR